MSIFPDSRIDNRVRNPVDWPGGRAGDVIVVEFVLMGQRYHALSGGPNEAFNGRVSLVVTCEDQSEVDQYWTALTTGGGEPVARGGLKDRYGMRWQIVPRLFFELVQDRDAEKSKRMMEAMQHTVKFDIPALGAAYRGS